MQDQSQWSQIVNLKETPSPIAKVAHGCVHPLGRPGVGVRRVRGRNVTGKRILVVDDDPSVRLMFKLIFESDGYQVSEARNGVAALILIKDSMPHLVVTGMAMPEMNGQELIARLRSDDRTLHLPILAVTGQPGAKEQASGADAVLEKPIDRLHLLATARSLTERKDQEQQRD
ncbi:MAG: response regulator [Candidatus Dormibacteraceae bacterium]